MYAFFDNLFSLIFFIVWLPLTWAIFKFIFKNTVTVSFNGITGLLTEYAGQFVIAGVFAGMILLIPLFVVKFLMDLVAEYWKVIAGAVVVLIALGVIGGSSGGNEENTKDARKEENVKAARKESTPLLADKASSAEAKFCGNCGAPVAKSEKFCGKCGKKI